MNILGISAFYHDAAAALVCDGRIVAAAQEERFSRRKHDADLPLQAMAFCLRRGGVEPGELDAVAFYDKPITTFSRLLATYLQVAPRGFGSFRQAMPVWLRQKLWVPLHIERGLRSLGHPMPASLTFTEHHESHAASAFFPSPFESAAILTFDGVGEWATTSIGRGCGNEIQIDQQLNFPHSLGLLYSAFTAHCGFRVNSGEYKLMGLAPYGEPTYVDRIMERLVDLRDDGSFRLDTRYFGYLSELKMTNRRFDELFDGPGREPESEITRRELDLARSIQVVTEEIVLHLARHAAKVTGERDACLAGGVALNCVSNSRLLREGPFGRVWVQPAAGDAGGALGAALYVWHQLEGGERHPNGVDAMSGSFLGPAFGHDEIAQFLETEGAAYEVVRTDDDRARRVASELADGAVVGVFVGRMEFGPRALGHRSILGDPRSETMQSTMNLKVKRRESFRPFAPAVLAERAGEWFDLDAPSPYMTFVAPVLESRRLPSSDHHVDGDLRAWVNEPRSDIPAVTHVDHSARLQTVDRDENPEFHRILSAFDELTGCPVLVNTSFNVRGEPIVCTPEDAYRCFMATELDVLVLEQFVLRKVDQTRTAEIEAVEAFALD